MRQTKVPAQESKPDLLDLYRRMFLIRVVEETLLELFARGQVRGTVHTSIGQECGAVGFIGALDREVDLVFSNHRGHGHYLAWSDDAEGLIAEVLGRPEGVCGGIGGSQHLHMRNFYSSGVQGGMLPIAVGAALAEKRKGSSAVAAVFLGDGTMGQGIVYEAFNLAALWRLPVAFVLEDNGIAQSTPKALAHAGELAGRADTFGLSREICEAEGPLPVRAAALRAIESAREGRPSFLVLNTLRLAPHSKGDDTRPAGELTRLRARDPLPRFASGLDAAQRRAVEEAVRGRVQRAVEAIL
jgi:TPP-dependent pyruvate/acetoin dehydrogenase alpha subunit